MSPGPRRQYRKNCDITFGCWVDLSGCRVLHSAWERSLSTQFYTFFCANQYLTRESLIESAIRPLLKGLTGALYIGYKLVTSTLALKTNNHWNWCISREKCTGQAPSFEGNFRVSRVFLYINYKGIGIQFQDFIHWKIYMLSMARKNTQYIPKLSEPNDY